MMITAAIFFLALAGEPDCPMHAQHTAAAHADSTAASPDAPKSADSMPADCPMHAQHMASAAMTDPAHGAGVDARHDSFGFSHESTHHNFRMFADGGAIELRADDPAATATVDAIRKHIREVASDFASANFSKPQHVHGHTPDGIETMVRLAGAIDYRYEEVPGGARVRITTKSADALDAVHAFIRFQVAEHRTSDSGHIESDSR